MQRDISDSDDSNRILRHESALQSTSLASEFQFGETANNGAAENCSAVSELESLAVTTRSPKPSPQKMKSIHITTALTIACHFLLSSDSYAGTLIDGDFTSWTFGATGAGSVTREAAGGNPGARINLTTMTANSTVYGTAIKNDFFTNVPFAGDSFTLSLDILRAHPESRMG